MLTVIWFHVFLYNTNNFQANTIWPEDGTVTGTTTPNQSGPWSNGNEEVPSTPKSFKTGAWPSDIMYERENSRVPNTYIHTPTQIYIYIYIYIFIYIHMCVCVCVCVCSWTVVPHLRMFDQIIKIFFLYNFIGILSSFLTSVCGFGLELVDAFTKIVLNAFRPFIGHHQRLFANVEIFFLIKVFRFIITLQKLRKRIVRLNWDADNIERM